jgi:hypothetical protein
VAPTGPRSALPTVAISVIFGATAVQHDSVEQRRLRDRRRCAQLTVSDPGALRTTSKRSQMFGTVDVIERERSVPGSVDTVEVRNQDPHGPYERRRARQGRYPNRSEKSRSRITSPSSTTRVGHPVDLGDGRPQPSSALSRTWPT